MNTENTANGSFNDYLDKDAPVAPDLKVISDTVYQRLFDVTFGYLISSVSALFLLVMLMTTFYVVFDGIATSTKALPKTSDVLNALGMSWFILLAVATGFFAGGVALFNSIRVGRTILKYMFTVWGLIMLFEIRYSINRFSSATPDLNGVLAVAAVVLLVIALAYMMYRSYRDKSISVMVVFNSIAIVLNIIFIVLYFVSFSGAMTDRHIHYLSLFLIAAIVLQTYEAAVTFFPLIRRTLVKSA